MEQEEYFWLKKYQTNVSSPLCSLQSITQQIKKIHLLNFASHWKDSVNCQYPQLNSKAWDHNFFRPKAGKRRTFPVSQVCLFHSHGAAAAQACAPKPSAQPRAGCARRGAAAHRPRPPRARITNRESALGCSSSPGNTAGSQHHYLHMQPVSML